MCSLSKKRNTVRNRLFVVTTNHPVNHLNPVGYVFVEAPGLQNCIKGWMRPYETAGKHKKRGKAKSIHLAPF